MPGTPPDDHDRTKSTNVSPLTQYSINLDESEPTIPFFEAHTAAIAADAGDSEIILGEEDFTIWQTSNAPVETSQGLLLTPP